jgi:hypothetical protein
MCKLSYEIAQSQGQLNCWAVRNLSLTDVDDCYSQLIFQIQNLEFKIKTKRLKYKGLSFKWKVMVKMFTVV